MSIIEKALNKSKSKENELNSILKSDSMKSVKNSILLAIDENTSELKITPTVNDDKNIIVDVDWKRLSDLGFATPGSLNTETIEEYRKKYGIKIERDIYIYNRQNNLFQIFHLEIYLD